ncbi:MAG TPA: 30S ribosomal protein S20 [Acholeplasma sp.]|jgi:small subunit ribosomal protein S20|nr:30S ribosomal protein S20 [Acholeplasmatales bacterium]HHV33106.1 30S ribosomal protein S20 [Acholeplasma sp.]
MANIKQQIKRNRTNEKKRQLNKSYVSSTKTAMKAVLAAVEANDKDKAIETLNFANKKLDKGQAKGIYHRNYVANKKSQLAKLVNSL